MNMNTKYVARKFDGDDRYSWAVFKASDVTGIRGIVFDAYPVCSGMDQREAQSMAKRFTVEGIQ